MQEYYDNQNEILISATTPKYQNLKFANKYLLIILSVYLFSGIIIELIEPLYKGFLLPYLQGMAQLLLMFLPALLLSKYSPLPFKKLFRSESKINPLMFILSIIGIIALSVFETSYLYLQEKFIPGFLFEFYKTAEKAVDELYNKILGGDGFFDCIKALTIGAIIPALSEETLFRGLYQRSLEEDLKPFLAIIITSMVFAIVHLNPISIIPLFAIGLFLGVVAYGTKSLLVPIILHFLNNAIAVIIMYSPSLSQLDDISYNLTNNDAVILVLISSILISIISLILFRNGKKN